MNSKIVALFLVLFAQALSFPRVNIESNNFANIFLRIDGSSCGTTSTGPGCGNVNAQYTADGYETFTLYKNADSNYCIVSDEFPTVRLRLDCGGVTSFSGSGVGSVNAQYYATNADCGGYEEFKLVSVGNLYAIQSVAFPQCYLRIDGSSCGTTSTGSGCGIVNAQYYTSGTYPGYSGTAGLYELFQINPVCSLWNGNPIASGNLIALQSQVVQNGEQTYELANNFVMPGVYGSNPENMYTFMAINPGTTPPLNALFGVDSVSANSNGYDVTLTHYQTGYQLAADYSVDGYPTQQQGLSESPYLSDTFRLALVAADWTSPSCGNCASTMTVSAPNIIPQFVWNGVPQSCDQRYQQDSTFPLWWSCDSYYVAVGGYAGESNTQYAVDFSTYNLWVCNGGTGDTLLGEEIATIGQLHQEMLVGIGAAVIISFLAVVIVLVSVIWWLKRNPKVEEEPYHSM